MNCNRRFFLFTTVAATTLEHPGAASPQSTPTVTQNELLFWMDEPTRAKAKALADSVAHSIDEAPGASQEQTRRWYAWGSPLLRKRWTADEFARRIAQGRADGSGRSSVALFKEWKAASGCCPIFPTANTVS